MRAAEERLVEVFQGPARALGAGAGGKVNVGRPPGRLRRRGHEPTLPDSCPSLGRGVPRRLVAKRREIVKDVGTGNAEQDYRVGSIAVVTIDNRIDDKGRSVTFGRSELVKLRCAG